MLPVWQQAVKSHVENGDLAVVGVVQEQHPDRALLYRQWRQLDWPIFVDSLNLLDIDVVPIVLALDASGIVRHQRLRPVRLQQDFLAADYPAANVPESFNRAMSPDVEALRRSAEDSNSAAAWRELGDRRFLLGRSSEVTDSNANPGGWDAVAAYRKAVKLDSRDGRAHFRLGVALRAQSESPRRQEGDAQQAVEHWGAALAINPNQYIWRRRIQQYGPRLDKPYNFYYWVEQARKEIRARGEEPAALHVEPSGSEIVAPLRRGRATGNPASSGSPSNGIDSSTLADAAHDAIKRDTSFIRIEPVVTPARVRAGARVRVRVHFRVNELTRPYWNNEAEDLSVRLDLRGLRRGPDAHGAEGPQNVGRKAVDAGSVGVVEGELTSPNPSEPETQEDRVVEFELSIAENAGEGTIRVPAYALYYVCENKGGKCRYLRQDFDVGVRVDATAPTIR